MIPAARYPNGIELRAGMELHAAGRRLEGHAAVFDSPADIGGFQERISAGAFRASLAKQADVLALVDHDPTRLLGRTRAGTLRIAEDARGLAYSIDLPDTALGRDVLALAERGDLGGMSFGFTVDAETWEGRTLRTLQAVTLVEISVVHSFPAYQQTTVSARARAMGSREADARIRRLVLDSI